MSTIPGSTYAYWCVTGGALITAIYTFRSFFMTFHGKPRMSESTYAHIHESPWVVWLPLVILAIPSVLIGYGLFMPLLYNHPPLLGPSLFILPAHDVLALLSHEIISPWHSMLHAYDSPAFWLMCSGVLVSWVAYCVRPTIPAKVVHALGPVYRVFVNKYGFDALNQLLFVRGSLGLGRFFYRVCDRELIDGFFVNGLAFATSWFATLTRVLQSGYLYHYLMMMCLGLFGFLFWLVWV
ncbi:MAG: hypothetical protein B7X00_01780 [Legionella sp. 21-45-4]|nr:MAG: hypothetical protein B7X00_01780 [Legionella sp. 21-45-4]